MCVVCLMLVSLLGSEPLIDDFRYVATASAYGHWLDAGEFVAAAADLGIPHPPGSPLASNRK